MKALFENKDYSLIIGAREDKLRLEMDRFTEGTANIQKMAVVELDMEEALDLYKYIGYYISDIETNERKKLSRWKRFWTTKKR